MSPMDGLTLLDYARDHFPTLPVVMVTAYHSPASEANAMAKGAVAFLKKPFDSKGLLLVVGKAIERSRELGAGKTKD